MAYPCKLRLWQHPVGEYGPVTAADGSKWWMWTINDEVKAYLASIPHTLTRHHNHSGVVTILFENLTDAVEFRLRFE
jgi:hypothetical protein